MRKHKNKKCIGVVMMLFSLFMMLSCGKKYDHIGSFQGGLVLVRSVKTNKYGLFNSKKQEVIPCIYDTIWFNNNCLLVMLNGKYGAVTTSGTEKIPCRYDSISFDERFAIVKLDKKYGVFLDSKKIIPTEYDTFTFSKDKIVAELDGKNYNFDKNGKFLPDMLYVDTYRKDDGKHPSYGEYLAYKILRLDVDEVYFIDAESKERLAYGEIIIDGDTVVNVKIVRAMFDDEPPIARFIFKDGKKEWKANGSKRYPYTLEDNVLNIKEYADY